MKKNPFNNHHWLHLHSISYAIMICYALALYASSTTNINYWYDGLSQPDTPSLRGSRRQYEILDNGPRINEIIERMRQVGVSSERQHQLQQHLTLKDFATLSDRVLASAVNATHMDRNFTELGVIVYHGGYAVVNYDTLDMVYRLIDEAGGNYDELLNKYFKFISPGQREMIKERFINKKEKYTRQLVHRNLDEEKAYNQLIAAANEDFGLTDDSQTSSAASTHPPSRHNNIDYGARFNLHGIAQLPPRPSNLDEEKRLNQLAYTFSRENDIRYFDHRPVTIGMARSSIGKRKRSSSEDSSNSEGSIISVSDNEQASRREKIDLNEPRNLLDLHLTQTNIDTIHGIDYDTNDNDDSKSYLAPVVKKYGLMLERIQDRSKLKREFNNYRKDLFRAFLKRGRGQLINMGDNLSDYHELLIVLHFATEAEKHIRTGGDKLSKMDPKESSCIAFAKEHIASSVAREDFKIRNKDNFKTEDELEAASDTYWETNKKKIMESIGVMDFRPIISKDKDNFNTELKQFIDDDHTTMEVLNAAGSISAAFHYLNYNLRTEGGKMSSIIASTHVVDTALDGEINTEAKLVNVHGYIPHAECWLAGYIRNAATYDQLLLKYFDGVINAAFGPVFSKVLGNEVFGLDNNEELVLKTTMATRFGLGDLTPEEHEMLAKALLESRIAGGTTSALMRTLAMTLIAAIMTRDRVSLEAAAEMMDDEIAKYKESKISSDEQNDNVSKAINALTDHNDKKWNEDVVKLAKKLSSLYLGSIKTGLMSTLASKMYANGLDEDSTIEDITKRLTTLKDQYNSGESPDSDNDVISAFKALVKYNKDILVGDMSSLAKKLYNLHIGSAAGGTHARLMITLARNIYSNIDKQLDKIELDDITTQLESLVEQYDSKSSGKDEAEDSDLYKMFARLIDHNDKNRDISSLAEKLQALYIGWFKSGIMSTLASKMFGIKEWQLPYGSDLQTITYKLESLYNNHKSEQKIDQGDDLALAFKDLIKQQPSITEDILVK